MKKRLLNMSDETFEKLNDPDYLISRGCVILLALAAMFLMIGLFKTMAYPHRTWALVNSIPRWKQNGRNGTTTYNFNILYSTKDGHIVEEDMEYCCVGSLDIEDGGRIYVVYGKRKQGTYKAALAYTIDKYFVIVTYLICMWLFFCELNLVRMGKLKRELLHICVGYIGILILSIVGALLLLIYPRVMESTYKRLAGRMTIDFTDTVRLGTYEQDGDTSNGPEAIEWVVIDSDKDSITLMSKYIIDSLPVNYIRDYYDSLDSVDQTYMKNHYYTEYTLPDDAKKDWESSDLRQWLNDDFYNLAFSDEEKKQIQTVNLGNWNGVFSNKANSTEDKVYLLSSTEILKYQDIDILMPCDYTNYAKERGKDTDQSGFLLRDLVGCELGYSIYTSRESYFDFLVGNREVPYSLNESYFRYGIRPVIRINKN